MPFSSRDLTRDGSENLGGGFVKCWLVLVLMFARELSLTNLGKFCNSSLSSALPSSYKALKPSNTVTVPEALKLISPSSLSIKTVVLIPRQFSIWLANVLFHISEYNPY